LQSISGIWIAIFGRASKQTFGGIGTGNPHKRAIIPKPRISPKPSALLGQGAVILRAIPGWKGDLAPRG